MADTPLTISRTVARESLLFRSLRTQGIEQLQQTAADTWSDHNVHDPGITILEALCYVITEIGSQLNFSFEDLIATPRGKAEANINYPSAATNLPGKAVTITDIRKLLVDLPEIRNAWLDVTNESKIAVYYDPATQSLTYEATPAVVPITWGGLYSIQLEMESNDLNTNFLLRTIIVPPASTHIDTTISFKYWDEVTEEWFRAVTISSIVLEDTIVPLDDEQYEDYYSEWTITFSDGSIINDFPVWVKLVKSLLPGDPLIPNLLTALETTLGATTAGSPFVLYKARLMAAQDVVKKAQAVYQRNRNLGEDITGFTAMRLQDIALLASVEISPVADPVEVYAKILFAIESFFSPRPHFQSLQDLLAAGYQVEEIFAGPLLTSGFLLEKDLNNLSRGNLIYVSDLVHLILDVAGTLRVRDVSLNTYFNNFQAITNERNCIRIQKGFKASLSLARTQLTLTRNGVAIAIDAAGAAARLTALRVAAAAGAGDGPKDLPIPLGDLPQQGSYRSIQYELPAVYGTGAAGLPQASSPERVAQLKQLQGYLFLYDQVLANTFAQLAQVGDLFSVRPQQSKTYFYQSLYHVPGAQALMGDLAGASGWEDFTALPDNAYTQQLDMAGEPGDTFFQRRNAMLDYLLARTAENRQDYAAIVSTLQGASWKNIVLQEKAQFLEQYPVLSQARAQAYNYTLTNGGGAPDVWNSTNVGGYVQMVAAKLGFVTYKERTLLHPLTENFSFFNTVVPPGRRKYKLTNNGGADLMVSQNHFANDTAATEAIKVFLEAGRYAANYTIIPWPGGTFSFKLTAGIADLIYNGAVVLPTLQAALTTIRSVIELIGDKYSLEGIHVIEHILLRPGIKGTTEPDSHKLFNLPVVSGAKLTDPYSHVLTVLVPSGIERHFADDTVPPVPAATGARWRNPEYLLFAQQTILREAPAHLLVNIFIADIDTDPLGAAVDDRPSLQNIERKLQAWREAVADPAATVAVKRSTQRALVTVLEKLYSV